MSNAASQRIEHPAPAERRHWYLGRNGSQQGPFAFAEIVSFAGDETIDPNDLVWRPGLHNWVSVETISGLLSPPPLPASSSAPARFGAPPPLPLPLQSRAAIEKAPAAPIAPAPMALAPSPPTRPAETAEPDITARRQSASVAEETPSSRDEAETQSEATPLDALANALATLPAAAAEAIAPAEAAAAEGDLPEHEKEKLRGLVSGILEPPETKTSYFIRHWRGELPFATSLFVNGILLTAAMGGLYALVALFGTDILQALTTRQPAFALAVKRLAELREASPPLLRLAALTLPWLAAAGLYIWSLIGIFRSAINRL
ncbi:MAG: DUF4339 domain-containing protein [Stellaceae bacterium]